MSTSTEESRLRRDTRRWRGQVKRLLKLWEAQAALGWAIILILATLIGTIYVLQASRVAETGRRVQILQNDLAALKRDNAALERSIAEAQSLDQLQQRALTLGFVPPNPDNVEYIVVPDYPAVPEVPSLFEATPTPEPQPVTTLKEAIWLDLWQSFRKWTTGESGPVRYE